MSTWFTNRGQVIQVIIGVIALIFAGINAWPNMRGNESFSTGSIVFYLLIGLVIFQ